MPTKHDVHVNTTRAASISQAPKSSSTPRMSPTSCSDTSNVFTCSFCWQISHDSPHVVGQSARLACEPCYSSLIDLAVCWACGEVVVRGDDCVSLGWCFWHRVCYGCLFCGNKRVVKGTALGELYSNDNDEGVAGVQTGPGRGKGVEVKEVPLCANCLVENEMDIPHEDTLAQKALRRISHPDGGLSKRRWEQRLKHGQATKSTTQTRRASEPLSPSAVDRLPHFSGDRRASETQDSQAGYLSSRRTGNNPTIYVSMHDPFDRPAFKAYPTKPIPAWMQYRPSQLALRK